MDKKKIKNFEPGDTVAVKVNVYGNRYKLIGTYEGYGETTSSVVLKDVYKYGKGSFTHADKVSVHIYNVDDMNCVIPNVIPNLDLCIKKQQMVKERVKELFAKTFW